MSYHIHPDRQAGPSTSTSTLRGGSHTKGSTSTRGRGGRGRAGEGRGATEAAFDTLPTDLTPDVRTTSERRMATLESELVQAQEATLEKKMVVRYKGVRFFERQKCLRKIRQALRTTPTTPSSSKALFEARSDLYYVLHYPSKEKYIALFPEGHYVPFVQGMSKGLSGSEKKRWELRKGFRALLREGKVGMEVEKGLFGIQGEEDHVEDGGEEEEEEGLEEREEGEKGTNGKRGREADDNEEEEGKKSKSRKVVAEAPKEDKKEKKGSVTTTTTTKTKKEAAAPPAVISAPKPAQTFTKSTTTAAEPNQSMSKKDRKAEKDAKRKAAKEGSQTNVATKEEVKPNGWAGDDDFFA